MCSVQKYKYRYKVVSQYRQPWSNYFGIGWSLLSVFVERSHRTDKEEFYQFLEYTGDVDLNEKLAKWEKFYNLHRPHGAHAGFTPFEVLMAKMKGKIQRLT